MKNLHSFLVLAFLSLYACTDNSPSPSTKSDTDQDFYDMLLSSTATNIPNDVYGTLSITATSANDFETYELRGSFFNQPLPRIYTEAVEAGDVSVGPFTANVSYGTQNAPYYYDSFSGTSYIGTFGSTVNSSVTGSSLFPSMSDSIYIPEVIDFTIVNASKNHGIDLTWSPDAASPSGVVGIWVTYGYSQHGNNDPNKSLPNTSVSFIEFTTDDGSYNIPPSDLTAFPAGGKLRIRMGRGNATYPVLTNGDHMRLGALAITSQTKVLN